ncbi:hypothetical protein GCM10009433_02980 [Psychroflexus lacisalsi]|uniref:Uncharacterized protein n=1 Tax=Psychroflexus lacisalsi TaxID=503928 RepID=A0ABP3VDL4_9FLAO
MDADFLEEYDEKDEDTFYYDKKPKNTTIDEYGLSYKFYCR